MRRQPPRTGQQKERKRRSRIVVGGHSISRRCRTITRDLDLFHVLVTLGGFGRNSVSGRDQSGCEQRSKSNPEHDRLRESGPATVLPDGSPGFKTKSTAPWGGVAAAAKRHNPEVVDPFPKAATLETPRRCHIPHARSH